jgi:hypothetical protein
MARPRQPLARPRVVASCTPSPFQRPNEDTPLQRSKAVALQQAWGDRPCDHPTFSREYDNGERTGNYCCTQCGASISFREKAELMATRNAAPKRPRRG